jgi:carbon-monoxide dehydrogenase large subunit
MNERAPIKFGLGAPVRRLEDDALVRGQGRYTDDVKADGALIGYVLRSPHAHADFSIGDVEAAHASPGVRLVLTAADIAHLHPLPCIAAIRQANLKTVTQREIPLLCATTVRHVGDAVAFIVADTLNQARDAAERIAVDYEVRPAVADTMGALAPGAPKVYPDEPSNQAFRLFLGDEERTRQAFAKARRVSEIAIVNNRLVTNYMEPRSCLAQFDGASGRFTVTLGSQGVHALRNVLARVMGIDAGALRVVTPDVGGGFGTKSFAFREYPLTMEAARRLARPVKWTSDRTEHFMADAHGRDNVATARMAMDTDGRFLALEIDLVAAMGAYLHAFAPYIPYLGMIMATGLYDIAAMAVGCRGVYSHTTPTDAYRGAGRPEAAYLIERLVDRCAADLGMTPDAIRALNFIKPSQLPYKTQGGRLYDTGEFEKHMQSCMRRAQWAQFSGRNAEARKRGKIRGIGMSTYVEACAFAGSEPAYLTLNADGTFLLRIGTQSNGQGHRTAYAQLAAEKLGIDPRKIAMHQGDTDVLAKGGGTGGSRSVPLGGVSVVRASVVLADKMKNTASHLLEAAAADIDLSGGVARIAGTDRAVSYAEIAAASSDADRNAEGNFVQDEATYPNGTHICEVEIDPETGVVEVVAYTIVDDFGVTVNPLLLAGQVHGGVAQGIGQALLERTVFDESGQLLTASYMDYAMPRADNMPSFDFQTRNVPSTTNALGIKGAGEAGTIGACPAVMNAVGEALRREYGIAHIDMPATPQAIWAAIQAAKRNA